MTTALAYSKTDRIPKTEVTRIVPPPIPAQAFVRACTPSLDLTVRKNVYTDAQFYADLKKASKWIDAMGEAALKEHAEGKTRKLP